MLVTVFKNLALQLDLDVYFSKEEDVLTLVGDDIELIISTTEKFTHFNVVKNYYYGGSHLCGSREFKNQTITEVVTLIFMSTASEGLVSAHYREETDVLNKALEDALLEDELMRSLEIFWEENL